MGYRGTTVRRDLRGHPNFALSLPAVGESAIAYALREAAHLLSPPKVEDEDEAIECNDAAASVLGLKDDLERLWSQKQG